MLRYYNFQFKSALFEVWGTLETFHRAGHPIADFKSSFKSGLWNFGWFWFLEHKLSFVCLIWGGWLVQEYSFWDFVQMLCQKHETSLSHSYKSYLTGLCICCWMRCKTVKWIVADVMDGCCKWFLEIVCNSKQYIGQHKLSNMVQIKSTCPLRCCWKPLRSWDSRMSRTWWTSWCCPRNLNLRDRGGWRQSRQSRGGRALRRRWSLSWGGTSASCWEGL